MITQPKIAPQKPVPPTQTETKETRIKRCEQIAKLVQSKIEEQITNGEVKIRQKPLHIQLDEDKEPLTQNPERSIRDKITSLNEELSMLQQHIANQKQQQRMKEERKRKEASLLIERLKREKEEYRNKLKLNQMSSRLKYSALSEDVIKLMKERRESLIQEKKKDMEFRIYKNLNRRAEREDDQAKNQIGYWSKIKEIQEKKRHHSTKILPNIHRMSEQPQFGVNLETLQRKNSHKNIVNLAHKRSYSKQELVPDYQDIVNKFLERAKAKQAESKSQNTPNLNEKSRIVTHQAISEKNQSQIGCSRVGIMKNEKIEKIMGSYIDNKHKLLGNQYLKESLLRVDRSKSPRASTIQDNSILEQSLELKGNPAVFSRNDRLTNYEERRQKIFHNLLANKIDKAKAIEMLNPIENMLDRIHPEGIQARLRTKLDVFERHQRKLQQNQYWNAREKKKIYDFEESSEQVI